MNRITRLAITLSLIGMLPAGAAKFSRAQVSRVVNQVELLLPNQSKRSANVGATVSGTTAVQTGARSRAELTFPDESLVRLGSNSVFSFASGTRDVTLDKGTMLLQSERFKGRTRIKTAAVTAAITGTTIMLEFVPAVYDDAGNIIKPGVIKIIVIEGSLEFSLVINPRKKMRLKAGEMVVFAANATDLPGKLLFDIRQLVKTSQLINMGLTSRR